MLRCTFSINGGSFTGNNEFMEIGKAMFNPDPITGIKMMLMLFLPALNRVLKTK